MRTRHLMSFVALLAFASPAAAHPGHGLGGGSTSWLHYLTEPVHVAPWALLALGALSFVRGRRSVGRPSH